jgi:hypothetical protein
VTGCCLDYSEQKLQDGQGSEIARQWRKLNLSGGLLRLLPYARSRNRLPEIHLQDRKTCNKAAGSAFFLLPFAFLPAM